jgi:hypothetical protein
MNKARNLQFKLWPAHRAAKAIVLCAGIALLAAAYAVERAAEAKHARRIAAQNEKYASAFSRAISERPDALQIAARASEIIRESEK